ncbi:riboflavin kinase [Agromyces sp. NPDC058484]|uniref:riboflavin kinase n=1 Tax=Agromyces sp. NPDC058484 TaxID=3346524 RepID=UPI00365DFFD7
MQIDEHALADSAMVTAAAPGVTGGVPSFTGRVVGGNGRGRLLGFPTANVAPHEEAGLPPDGVYACWVAIQPSRDVFGATMSIGNNPTFDDVAERRVEVFIHDLAADLYGRRVVVWVAQLLRPMRRFSTLDELIDHTAADVRRSRAALQRMPRPEIE